MSLIDYSKRGHTLTSAIELYEALGNTVSFPSPTYTDNKGVEWILRNEPWLFLHNLDPELYETDPVGTQFFLTREATRDMGAYAIKEITHIQTQICAAEGGGYDEKKVRAGFLVRPYMEVGIVVSDAFDGKPRVLDVPVGIDSIHIPRAAAGALSEQFDPEVIRVWVSHIPRILEASS